jgi:putative ABC transport system ATP-binding protein
MTVTSSDLHSGQRDVNPTSIDVHSPGEPTMTSTTANPTLAPSAELTPPPATGPIGVVAAAASATDAFKTYGRGGAEVHALAGVTVSFERGRFTAIMGPSGSGKSTLMQSVAGLDTLTSGSVTVAGIELSTLSDKELTRLRRDKIGFIFQAFNLVPTLTAKENILLPLDLAGRKPDRDWFDHVITTVGLANRLGHRPAELSGGQQQRVAVARALVSRPEIIFGDEPTGNLDSHSGAEVLSFLRTAVRELGQTVVMVTHDPVAASYADRIVFLADGHIVDEMTSPTAEQVLDRMKRFGR